jgi:glycosyltransferase involved in cell wall biosynthesis
MRILVLNHEFPPVGGGGGRAAEDICRGLAEFGHEIVVLTAHLEGLPHEEKRDGYTILRVFSLRTQPYKASLLSMAAYVLAGLWAGHRLFRSFKPEVIHAHFAVPAGALAWGFSWLGGVPYVLTVHLGDVPGGVPEKTGGWFRWIYPLTRRIWREANRIVAVSAFTRQLALKKYNAEIQVIPNGVDLNAVQPNLLHLNDPPRIVFAGRFMTQKNPEQVVRTLSQLKKVEWQCVMIGDGPLMQDVRDAVADSGLEDRFQFTGWIDPHEVLDWFDCSDILPVVGVQALARGLAIVASRVGGFVDLVDHDENGYLIDRENTDQFSASLFGLLSDSNRLLSFRNASLEKAKHFDINQVVKEYEILFQDVLLSKGSTWADNKLS